MTKFVCEKCWAMVSSLADRPHTDSGRRICEGEIVEVRSLRKAYMAAPAITPLTFTLQDVLALTSRAR